MSMLIAIQVEGDLLNVVVSGGFSLAEAKRTFIELLEAAALHQSKKVLLDGRKVVGNPETMERFYYGVFTADSVVKFWERGIVPGIRFAYVLKEPVLDPGRFGETVAVNRGMNIRVFESPAEALEWLEIVPANKGGRKTKATKAPERGPFGTANRR